MAITITSNNVISNTDLRFRPGNTDYPLYYYSNGPRYSDRTPAFTAEGTAGWLYHNNMSGGASAGNAVFANAMGWNWQQQGAGSYGMNSNGRYYAPLSGYYYFYFSTYFHNDNNSTNYIHLNFVKNDGYGWNNGRTPHNIYGHGTPYTYEDGIVVSCNMYLGQGEYCAIRPPYWNSNNQSRIYASHSTFSGCLIG